MIPNHGIREYGTIQFSCGAPFSTCACVYKLKKDVPGSLLCLDTLQIQTFL